MLPLYGHTHPLPSSSLSSGTTNLFFIYQSWVIWRTINDIIQYIISNCFFFPLSMMPLSSIPFVAYINGTFLLLLSNIPFFTIQVYSTYCRNVILLGSCTDIKVNLFYLWKMFKGWGLEDHSWDWFFLEFSSSQPESKFSFFLLQEWWLGYFYFEQILKSVKNNGNTRCISPLLFVKVHNIITISH